MASNGNGKWKGQNDPDSLSNFVAVDFGVSEFVAARAAELELMYQEASHVQGNARIMQKLPRHMRRRAASHNVKRLPANLRAIAKREVLHNAPNKGKRPSRRHRRRPGNLLSEYQRRQRTHVWLETHIWHAKRFHMAQHWGYRLPHFPNDKGWRACQRALAQYCIMWDMSYMCCIEIEGAEEEIITAMRRLMSEDTGLTVGAKMYLSGSREGSAVMYRHDAYPHSAIGPVSFLWRPVYKPTGTPASTLSINTASVSTASSQRCLWLWVHPSCYSTVLEELAVVFKALKQVDEESKRTGEEAMEVDENKDVKVAEAKAKETETSKTKEKPAEIKGLDNPEYVGPSVSFRSLKDTLCRYRLLGPKALSTLQEAFKQPASGQDSEIVNLEIGVKRGSEHAAGDGNTKYWWQEFDDSERNGEAWVEFRRHWEPAQAPKNSVLGLTVRDPRLFLPQKITNTEPQASDTSEASPLPWDSKWSYSPLWQKQAREKVKDTKMTEHQLNISRSQKLLPGSMPDLGLAESRIPLLLVQQSSSSLSPFLGSGYDVILPSGWGMGFWIALVYRGARVGGLRQLQQVDRELGRVHFLQDYPDTVAGQQWTEEHRKADAETYYKKPPAKRVNYEKLGTMTHAFAVSWLDLVKSFAENVDSFFVLRSRQLLRGLQQAVLHGDETALPRDVSNSALIPVRVTTSLKGVPSARAAICLPATADLENLKADRRYPGPSEPIHSSKNASKKQKTKDSEVSQEVALSRTVIGYVSEGDMSLSLGKGRGLGFVTFVGLQQLLCSHKGRGVKVLVRGITETVYRFHDIEVVC